MCMHVCTYVEKSFLSRATSKIGDLSHNCKQLFKSNVKIKWANEHFIEYNKSIGEVMEAIGF